MSIKQNYKEAFQKAILDLETEGLDFAKNLNELSLEELRKLWRSLRLNASSSCTKLYERECWSRECTPEKGHPKASSFSRIEAIMEYCAQSHRVNKYLVRDTDAQVYILEANPRVSRTMPLVSRAITEVSMCSCIIPLSANKEFFPRLHLISQMYSLIWYLFTLWYSQTS